MKKEMSPEMQEECAAAETPIEATAEVPVEAAAEMPAEERAEKKGRCEKKESPEKRLFGVRVTSLLLVCYIGAFAGWCVENVFRMVRIGVFDSRHQILPFLGAYGFGVFVLFFVFGTPTEMRVFKKKILPTDTKRNKILRLCIYYVLVFSLILFGEMSVGLLFEKCFGVKAWNYTKIPLHITRYTSIPTTFGFTTGITLLMHFVFRPVIAFLERIPRKTCFWLATTIGILIAADYCIMMGTLLISGHFPNYWSVRFKR